MLRLPLAKSILLNLSVISANLFNVILMKCRFVISRRDKVCKREGRRERESKMRRKKVHSQCGSEYQQ